MELIIGLFILFLIVYVVLFITKKIAFSLGTSVPGIILVIIIIILLTRL